MEVAIPGYGEISEDLALIVQVKLLKVSLGYGHGVEVEKRIAWRGRRICRT